MDKLRIFWMKVKKILILAICLCLVFVLVFHERSYTVTLEKNWQLDFSGKYKTIYAHEEDNNENIVNGKPHTWSKKSAAHAGGKY